MCLASLYPLLQPYWPMVRVMPVDYTLIIGIGKTWLVLWWISCRQGGK